GNGMALLFLRQVGPVQRRARKARKHAWHYRTASPGAHAFGLACLDHSQQMLTNVRFYALLVAYGIIES
ncbi:hypothetical protein SB780_38525, partial [Burkholderia sp. SIMBA_057]